MRPVVILLALLSLAAPSFGDIIHLKNGRRIVADRVRESNGRVEYEIGDDTYAISRSLVERIDTGVGAVVARQESMPVLVPEQGVQQAPELVARVVRDGKVDTMALAALDDATQPELAAAAFFAAAQHEQTYGSPDRARAYLERAVHHLPENAALVEHYVAALLQLRRYRDAVTHAERATKLAPNSADAFGLLGLAYFHLERTQEAIQAWKRSLQLRPSAIVERYLAQAERDLAAESGFGQQESGHFTLRYEGRRTSASLRRDLLATLEAQYDDLVRELGVVPRQSIAVILYTEQAFSDVTQAPAWIGALNDGKLRIPMEGLETVTPELARVLKHELAHSFVNQITGNRCPVWLNEGVAMALEPRSVASHGRALAQLFQARKQIPLNTLEGPFLGLPKGQATVAYVQSLAAVEYIRSTYGMSDVVRVLERIGDGATAEAALRATVRADYGRLEEEIADYLKRTYGE